jgi:hypothetical protein
LGEIITSHLQLCIGVCKSTAKLKWVLPEFYIDDILLSDEFLLVPGLREEAIIGSATMQKWRIKLYFEHDRAIVDPKVSKMQLV